MEFQMSREIYQMQCHLLSNLRKEGKFCDVVIQTNQSNSGGNDRPMNISAHSCILSATSFIFYRNFTVNKTPESPNSFRIFSRGIKPEIWELVLEYIYLRKMTVASGLSKENLCSLFWLLRDLHLINEVEYKKILNSSCKIFGFDILAASNNGDYAIRFEQVTAENDFNMQTPDIHSSINDNEDANEKSCNNKQDKAMTDEMAEAQSVQDDMDHNRDGNTTVTSQNTEKSKETPTTYDQEPVDSATNRNDTIARKDNEHHMHLPVYEENEADETRFRYERPEDSSYGVMEPACTENTNENEGNEIHSSTIREADNQGSLAGLSNIGQESDDDDNVDDDFPAHVDMDCVNQSVEDNQSASAGYPCNDICDNAPPATDTVSQLVTENDATKEIESEARTFERQTPNSSGEPGRDITAWTNRLADVAEDSGTLTGMEHGLNNEESGTVTNSAMHSSTDKQNEQHLQEEESSLSGERVDNREASIEEANDGENSTASAERFTEEDNTISASCTGDRNVEDKDTEAQTCDSGEQECRETEEQNQVGRRRSLRSHSAAAATSNAFMENEPEETPDANDIFKTEWERLAGNFAFKSLCKISVLGKDDNGQIDHLPNPDLIKKEHDLGYENDVVKEPGKHTVSKKKKQKRKKVKGMSKGPWYSCSDCDQRFSTYVLFQKHQCNGDDFTKKTGLSHSEDLYLEPIQPVKPGKRSRKKRRTSNTDKWLPKPITIVPENSRYSSDIENYSHEINGMGNAGRRGDSDPHVALVSFGGKDKRRGAATNVDSDDTDVDQDYQNLGNSNDDSDEDVEWPAFKKSKRRFKITRKKKDITLLKNKRGRPHGSKNKKVKALKVKLEVDLDDTIEDEDNSLLKKKRGRPKGSKNKIKIKVEGEEGDQASDGEEKKERPKKIRKRKRSASEKPSPIKTPRSKLITTEGEDLKGGRVEGTGENPAAMGRVARVFDVCNLCGEKVPEGGSKMLRIHQKTVCKVALSPDFKDRPRNICPFCQKKLSRNSELNIHIKIHHMGGHPYKCRLCQEEFNTRDGVKQHMINVHDVERIKCQQCNKVFLDQRNYNKHFSTCGPDGQISCAEKQSKGCMCHICGHVSVNEGKNRVHLLYHKPPSEWEFHCEVCNQAFAQKSDLKKHRMIHTGEKPYLCDLCPYATNRTSNLKLHMRKHTAEKSEVTKNKEGALVYKCIECASTFSLKTELKDHLKVHDTKQSRCFKKFRPRTKEDMQHKVKKPASLMRKHRAKYQPKMMDVRKTTLHEESGASAMDEVPTVVRDITMASLGPMAASNDEGLVPMGLPQQSRAGMIAMNPHVTSTDSSGMMGIGPSHIGTDARMMGYIGMAHYGNAGGERLLGMSGEMPPVMEDRMMQIRGNVGAVDERMHRIRNEESMLGYALRNNMPEAAYMNL